MFPAAIESDVLMAIAKADTSDPGRVTAENIDSKYTRQTFAPEKNHLHEWTLDIDKTQLRWESYVKAGYYVRYLHAFFSTVPMNVSQIGSPRAVLQERKRPAEWN